ncbi:hypothetical protein FIBSPDRAFT_769994, partial [Athelia psychrophila]
MSSLTLKFEGTNTGPRAFLAFKGLVDTKWDGKEEISELVSRLRVYQHTLTALGFPLDDTIYAFVLLYTLPDTPENAQLWSTITSSVAKNDFYCSLHKDNVSHNTPECFALKKQEAEKKRGYKGKGKAKEEGHSAQEDTEEYNEDGEVAMMGRTHVSAESKWNINAYISSEPDTKGHILLDTGASSTMVPYVEWFEPESLRALNPPRPIGFGDDSEVFALAVGTIRLNTGSG